MVKSRNIKKISLLLLLTVLLFSFYELKLDLNLNELGNTTALSDSNITHAVEVSHIVVSERLVSSSSQIALLRHEFAKKAGSGMLFNSVIPLSLISILFLILSVYLNLCINNLKQSHRVIVDYIHKKDGQKA